MNEKIIFFIFVIMLIVLLVLQQVSIQNSTPKIDFEKELAEINIKIDSLYITRDSIVKEVQSTKTKITELEKDYEKARDSIINQSISSDSEYFSNYISNYLRRFSGNNNR